MNSVTSAPLRTALAANALQFVRNYLPYLHDHPDAIQSIHTGLHEYLQQLESNHITIDLLQHPTIIGMSSTKSLTVDQTHPASPSHLLAYQTCVSNLILDMVRHISEIKAEYICVARSMALVKTLLFIKGDELKESTTRTTISQTATFYESIKMKAGVTSADSWSALVRCWCGTSPDGKGYGKSWERHYRRDVGYWTRIIHAILIGQTEYDLEKWLQFMVGLPERTRRVVFVGNNNHWVYARRTFETFFNKHPEKYSRTTSAYENWADDGIAYE